MASLSQYRTSLRFQPCPIPSETLTRIERLVPEQAAAIAALRANDGDTTLVKSRELAASVIWAAQKLMPLSMRELAALQELAHGLPYASNERDGRDNRIRELAAAHYSTSQIVRIMSAEGWGRISRARVHQIIKGA
jgi:hypothetical protein